MKHFSKAALVAIGAGIGLVLAPRCVIERAVRFTGRRGRGIVNRNAGLGAGSGFADIQGAKVMEAEIREVECNLEAEHVNEGEIVFKSYVVIEVSPYLFGFVNLTVEPIGTHERLVLKFKNDQRIPVMLGHPDTWPHPITGETGMDVGAFCSLESICQGLSALTDGSMGEPEVYEDVKAQIDKHLARVKAFWCWTW